MNEKYTDEFDLFIKNYRIRFPEQADIVTVLRENSLKNHTDPFHPYIRFSVEE